MNSSPLERLRGQIGGPRDGALLRVSIGNLLLAAGDAGSAAREFRAALEFDAGYSAAWKMLGRALSEANDTAGAIDAYAKGIAVADERGDKQAAKEMTVFLRRLRKSHPS
jgi:predicted Zn-dependent protease